MERRGREVPDTHRAIERRAGEQFTVSRAPRHRGDGVGVHAQLLHGPSLAKPQVIHKNPPVRRHRRPVGHKGTHGDVGGAKEAVPRVAPLAAVLALPCVEVEEFLTCSGRQEALLGHAAVGQRPTRPLPSRQPHSDTLMYTATKR